MEYLIKKLYGRKTEKTSAIDGQLIISDISLGLFNEAEKEADLSVLEPVPFEEPVKRTRKGYQRKSRIMSALPYGQQANVIYSVNIVMQLNPKKKLIWIFKRLLKS